MLTPRDSELRTSIAPHSPQSFACEGLSNPHCEQRALMGVPHSLQNFIPSRFSNPQLVHRISLLSSFAREVQNLGDDLTQGGNGRDLDFPWGMFMRGLGERRSVRGVIVAKDQNSRGGLIVIGIRQFWFRLTQVDKLAEVQDRPITTL